MLHNNNFDFLRLIFALFVIVTHSYPLTGIENCDAICQITSGQMHFSYIGIKGFFIISGYLIFQSLDRSKGIADYYWKRILRLFPALIVVLLLTILLAPLVYENKTVSYWNNDTVWSYFYNNLSLYRMQYAIDGVFKDNPYGPAINGSLWSICYEFSMYVMLSGLFLFRNHHKVVKVLVLMLFAMFLTLVVFFDEKLHRNVFYMDVSLFLNLGLFFFAGVILSVFKYEKNKNVTLINLIALGIVVLSVVTQKYFTVIQFIFIPLLIIGVGIKSTKYINAIASNIGDLSYGIYIYAFPVQQTLIHFFKLNHISLTLYTAIISVVLAYFSWHLVEKNALKLKKIKPQLVNYKFR
jgi:peptidoglycan/LPS O-acetylase OafA/YrhL